MAIVQRLCRDLTDTFHAAGDRRAGGTVVIQPLHQLLIALPLGIVLDHADLLPDDALLLLHRLVGKIGYGDEGQQNLQVLIELLRGAEIVTGNGVGGKGIWLRAVFCQLLQRVALGGVEHLVLQIMGDARRGVQPLSVQLEFHIHAAVAGGKQSIFPLEAFFRYDADRQAVGQRLPPGSLTDAVIVGQHTVSSFPFRKNTVSSRQLCAAFWIRSGVT